MRRVLQQRHTAVSGTRDVSSNDVSRIRGVPMPHQRLHMPLGVVPSSGGGDEKGSLLHLGEKSLEAPDTLKMNLTASSRSIA
jgi:hypothetical protein